jgi:hypothetical protein
VISASNDKTVKIWDVGGVDAQRVSAPVKRAQYQRHENFAAVVPLLAVVVIVPDFLAACATTLAKTPCPSGSAVKLSWGGSTTCEPVL